MDYNDFLNNASGEEPVFKLDLGNRDCIAYIIGDISKPYFKKSHLTKMKKAELVELSEKYLGYYSFNPDEYTKAEMVEGLKDISIKKHYEMLAENYTYWEFQENIPHDWFTSKGYSQGDARIVIRVDAELTKSYKEYIHHILWDSPINFKLTVDGTEYNGDEFMKDYYEYDKREILGKIKAHPDLTPYVKIWVEENLPDYPEYRD
jgi:hypothetical protein